MPKKNTWTQKEDKLLVRSIKKFGKQQWASIAVQMQQKYGLKKRTGKQYRQRWINHLDPTVNKGKWSRSEQAEMFKLHEVHGNKWRSIAQGLPGRSENAVKNHFYSTIRRSLRRISKYLGSKNSSWQVKSIKPAALSAVFDIISGMRYKNRLESQKESKNEIAFEFKQKEEQQFEKFIKENCQNLSIDIFYFSSFSTKNMSVPHSQHDQQISGQQSNQKHSQNNGLQESLGKANHKLDEKSRDERLSKILEKMQVINNLYQKIKQKREPYQRRRRNSPKNQKLLLSLSAESSVAVQDQMDLSEEVSFQKPLAEKIKKEKSFINYINKQQVVDREPPQKRNKTKNIRQIRKIRSSKDSIQRNCKRKFKQTIDWSIDKQQLKKQEKNDYQIPRQFDNIQYFKIIRNVRLQQKQRIEDKQKSQNHKVVAMAQQMQEEMWDNQVFCELQQIAIDQLMDEQQQQRNRRFSNNFANKTPKLRTTPLAMSPRQPMWSKRSFGQVNPDEIEIKKNQLNDFLSQVKIQVCEKNDQLKRARQNSLSNDTGNDFLKDYNI